MFLIILYSNILIHITLKYFIIVGVLFSEGRVSLVTYFVTFQHQDLRLIKR